MVSYRSPVPWSRQTCFLFIIAGLVTISFLTLMVIPGESPGKQSVQASASSVATPTPDEVWGEIDSGGNTREYLQHLPPGYDPDGPPLPLVVNLHAFASNATQQAWMSGFSEKADEAGFIVVYPQGLGFPTRWNMMPSDRGVRQSERAQPTNTDLMFIRDLVAYLQGELNIDPDRIYATGISNGGGMSNRLACDMSETFAAIASVAGAYMFADTCEPQRPVPILAFHGTSDAIVPYEARGHGLAPILPLLPVPEWAAGWAVRNGCDTEPMITMEVFEEGEVTIETWGDCFRDVRVVLYTIKGLGHVWPGGRGIPLLNTDTGPVNATDVIWAFFAANPLSVKADE